jgi:UDPglucose 6-dehydrogenase
MNGLFMATERLISPKYLLGGMGDGGGCHPRDNIALSWLAKELNMSYDWYENLMICRENQTEWLGDLFIDEMNKNSLPGVILGKCFKKETNLTVGSPSILLKNLLDERGVNVDMFDPWIDDGVAPLDEPKVYFIGTNHDIFINYNFPKGSVVIDPWRFIKHKDGINVIHVGIS